MYDGFQISSKLVHKCNNNNNNYNNNDKIISSIAQNSLIYDLTRLQVGKVKAN